MKAKKTLGSLFLASSPLSIRESYFDRITPAPSPRERIVAEVLSWPEVSAGPGRRGEFSFKVGRLEIGHLHGAVVAHFAFPKDLWEELLAERRVVPHPLDRPGLAARPIRTEEDVEAVIGLMRLNYDRLYERRFSTAGAVS